MLARLRGHVGAFALGWFACWLVSFISSVATAVVSVAVAVSVFGAHAAAYTHPEPAAPEFTMGVSSESIELLDDV